jgi:hypothetical protein
MTTTTTVLIRYKEYRDEQAKLHAAWLERDEARRAAIARGDPNPPRAEGDPTAEREIGVLGLAKFLFWLVVGLLLAGKFVTGEWMWGGRAWVNVNVRRWLPVVGEGGGQGQQRLFSEKLLANFDGSVPEGPIYLAVSGAKGFFTSFFFFCSSRALVVFGTRVWVGVRVGHSFDPRRVACGVGSVFRVGLTD